MKMLTKWCAAHAYIARDPLTSYQALPMAQAKPKARRPAERWELCKVVKVIEDLHRWANRFHDYCKQAGVDGPVPHRILHAAATEEREVNGDLAAMRKIGNVSPQSLQRYTRQAGKNLALRHEQHARVAPLATLFADTGDGAKVHKRPVRDLAREVAGCGPSFCDVSRSSASAGSLPPLLRGPISFVVSWFAPVPSPARAEYERRTERAGALERLVTSVWAVRAEVGMNSL